MADAATAVANKLAWVDLATKDPAGARDFYSKLFGWDIEVNPDPQYGGYGIARVGGQDVAGMGGVQSPDQPSAWSLYVGSDDLERLSRQVEAAGGSVVAPPFDVGDQGRMAVFRDPSGAFISSWQPAKMGGFQAHGTNTFDWAELNARGIDRALPFYRDVFGWTTRSVGTEDQPYTELQVDGQSIAGATEMNPMIPAEVPSYWLVYFAVDDIDQAFRRAIEAGASEMLAPQQYPGGRFAILTDPQGASFGLMQSDRR